MTWQVILSRRAVQDARKLNRAGLRAHAEKLLKLLADDPFSTPPSFEKLVGNLSSFYSRRINILHRLIYRVDRKGQVVQVLRMWTHCQ